MSRRLLENGFSLIELMIALLIIAILAGIAIPAYQNQIDRARRADAKAGLMQLTSAQERFFTQFVSYTDQIVGPGACAGIACGLNQGTATSPEGDYNMVVAVTPAGCAPGTPVQCTAYTITATPIAAGDTECTTLGIDNLGRKQSTGTGTVDACWR